MAINPVNINQLNNVDLNQTNQTSRQQNNVVGNNQVNTSVNDSRIGNNAFQADLTKAALNKSVQPNEPNTAAPNTIASRTSFEPIKKEDNKAAADFVRKNRAYIQAAAKQYNVAPELIGNILFQEKRNAGAADRTQDAFANDWLKQRAEGKTTLSLEAFRDKYKENRFDFGRQAALKSTVDKTSFGSAQMQLGLVKELIGKGLVKTPNGVSGVNIPSPQEWSKLSADEKNEKALSLLMNDKMTPYLVGARAKQTVDHWKAKGGTDISNPNVTNRNDIGNTNHYRILTQLYSVGLEGKSGVGKGDELRKYKDINESGQDAVTNLPVTIKALYTDEPFYGFEKTKLPKENGGIYPNN
jgi:hypothetical protein